MTRFTSNKKAVIAYLDGYPGTPRIFKEEALGILQRVTGQDFGYDTDAWARWLDEHKYDDRIWGREIRQILAGPRKPVLICFGKSHTEELFDPTTQQVESSVEALDGHNCLGLALHSSTIGTILMWGGRDERVTLSFLERLGRRKSTLQARLIDNNVGDPDRAIAVQIGKRETFKKLRETVTIAVANEVAVHFLQNDTLPKGFHWTQDVTAFT